MEFHFIPFLRILKTGDFKLAKHQITYPLKEL